MTISSACVRRPQRGFDRRGRVAAREQEAEVAVALGQRHDAAARRHGDLEPGDARDRARRVLAVAPRCSTPARGIGSIITPDARRLAGEAVERHPERVPQDHLLERDAGAEAQRARAQPADRPRRDLDHPDAVAVDAELGVHRTFGEPDRARTRARSTSSTRRERRRPRGATA